MKDFLKNQKKYWLFSLFVGFVLMFGGFLQSVSAQHSNTTDLFLFYGEGCPHCAKAKLFLEDIVSKYPSLNVSEYEIYFDQDNNRLFQELAHAFDTEVEGVPTIFIDDKVIVGFSDAIGDSLENEIQRCLEYDCGSPFDKLSDADSSDITKIIGGSSPLESPKKESFKKQLTIPAVISAAAVDAINPCAFAVLIILLTTVLATKSKKRALLAGLAFSLSIYISYFLIDRIPRPLGRVVCGRDYGRMMI